ncbi:hypothetical protein [Mucilaginibacter gynuensis]|uniref:hypothetical protein n=1 Tax=Mucilaginibacter gynuensis TaxID=1302236 RepID=UPI0031F1684C
MQLVIADVDKADFYLVISGILNTRLAVDRPAIVIVMKCVAVDTFNLWLKMSSRICPKEVTDLLKKCLSAAKDNKE